MPKRRIEERQRRHLASKDRGLVDLFAAEREADLRIRAHAFGGPVDGHFALAAAGDEFNPHSRGFTGTEREAGDVLGGKTGHGDGDLVFASQGERRDRRRASLSGNGLAHGAGRGVHYRDLRVLDHGARLIDHRNDHRRCVRRLRGYRTDEKQHPDQCRGKTSKQP